MSFHNLTPRRCDVSIPRYSPRLLLFVAILALAPNLTRAESSVRIITSAPKIQMSTEEIDSLALEKTPVDAAKNGFFAHEKIDALFSQGVYLPDASDESVAIPFRLYEPPQTRPQKRYPLVVVWHGQGESDDDNSSQLAHLQYDARSFFKPYPLEAYILATQCPGDSPDWENKIDRYDASPIDYTVAIIRALERIFPIDPTRISALGICSGASAALQAQSRNPKLFCALALCSYSVRYGAEPEIDVPVWAFANSDDPNAPIEPIRDLVLNLRQRGASAKLTESVGGHDSWTMALRDCQILSWLARQDADAYAPPPPGAIFYQDRNVKEILCLYALPIAALVFVFAVLEPALCTRLWTRRTKKRESDWQDS